MAMHSVILLDIEGTTTPISFVYEVLFPFARRHLRRFLADHAGDPGLCGDLELLAVENREDRRVSADVPEFSDGAKTKAESYLRIADQLEISPADGLFLSDSVIELDAASGAGWEVRLAVRSARLPIRRATRPLRRLMKWNDVFAKTRNRRNLFPVFVIYFAP